MTTPLQTFTTSPYNLEYFKDFIQEAFPQAQLLNSPAESYKDGHIIHAYTPICQDIELESSNILQVFEFKVGSTHAKITLHKELAKIAKNNASHILACFYNPRDPKEFRLSLITTGFDFEANKTTHSNLRRQSFVLGDSIPTHTAQKQLQTLIDSQAKSKQALEEAFSLEPVTKEFYKEIVGIFITLIDSIQLPTESQAVHTKQTDSKKTAKNVSDSQAEGFCDNNTKAENVFDETAVGGRIFDEKAGLCSGEQGDKTRVSIDAASHKLPAFSQKANAQNADSSDNTKREFALRLLSRLLFCKFLEKKGVIDQAIFSTTLSDNYYHEVLEPLFFSTLNTPRDARDYDLLDPHIAALLKQIPYLNGGLFAPQASDFYSPQKPTAYHATLKVPNAPLAELFTLLESYHFSIDESTPDSQEVGLNPELLGLVFESLLSELFTDNRKDSTASLRKSTGSYYTPREIVRYMCRSSLYQFLLTKLDSAFGLESRISSPRLCDSHSRLISARGSKSHDSSSKILESTSGNKTAEQKSSLRGSEATAAIHNSAPAESNQINGARKACNLESVVGGLGAKGVKKEGGIRESSLPIQAPLSPLEKTLSQAKLESSNTAKKVDSSFTPSLRADEIGAAIHALIFHHDPSHLPPQAHAQILSALQSLKVLDPACGSGAFPIGLMQELLELGEILGDTRSPYTRKLEILQSNIYGIDIQPMATEISRLRCFLSLILEEAPKDIKPLPNLEFKFLSANSLLPLPQAPTNLDKNIYDEIMQTLLQIRKDNFSADTKDKPILEKDYHKAAQSLAKSLVFSQDEQSPLTSWNPYDPHSVAEFFDSEYMFGLSGFDIVIGNPPYMQVQKGIYPASHFPYSEGKDKGKQNLYKVFVEHAYNIANDKGISCLITQSSLMCDLSASYTRNLLLTQTQIQQIIEFPKNPPTKEGRVFKSVLQGTCIVLFVKDKPLDSQSFNLSINNDKTTINKLAFETIAQKQILDFYPQRFEIPLITQGEMPLLQKIKTDKVLLESLLDDTLQGNINTIHLRRIQAEKETGFYLMKGENIHRYYFDNNFMHCKISNETTKIVERNQKGKYIIAMQGITGTTDINRIHCTLLESKNTNFVFLDSTKMLFLSNANIAKFIVGILNSRIIDWLFRKTSTNNNINIYELESLPIPKITESNKPLCDEIIKCVDKILESKAKDSTLDTKELESQIDSLVYKLYNLTNDEIEIIEKE